MTISTKLDHLVIGATDLESGVAYVREQLGVDIPKGGEHKTLGTHNHVMQLGDDIFLEVVAPSPTLPAPGRPRWFGLDDPYVMRQLENEPGLIAWVVNTSDLQSVSKSTPLSIGQPVDLQRGDLSWTFSLPADGRLLAHGMFPYVMQWHMPDHPSRGMADTGCRLQQLEICHGNQQWLQESLTALGKIEKVTVSAASDANASRLLATINTPDGPRQLRSPPG